MDGYNLIVEALNEYREATGLSGLGLSRLAKALGAWETADLPDGRLLQGLTESFDVEAELRQLDRTLERAAASMNDEERQRLVTEALFHFIGVMMAGDAVLQVRVVGSGDSFADRQWRYFRLALPYAGEMVVATMKYQELIRQLLDYFAVEYSPATYEALFITSFLAAVTVHLRRMNDL